jgi:WD40 repeat protein
LEQATLMALKRLPNPFLGSNSVESHQESNVFRSASGLSLDFPAHDASMYFVSTDDGLVHRCSTSYNEQYLESYFGHKAAVYKVRCNPFYPYAFLTCSADWSMKLWNMNAGAADQACVMTFQSTDLHDSVNDICWSRHNSSCFAACMDDGRVEVWELSKKALDPLIMHKPNGESKARTCVRFAVNSPVLICGDVEGVVDVMRMHNTEVPFMSQDEQQTRLLDAMTGERRPS